MHKYFFRHNNLTEKNEISKNGNIFSQILSSQSTEMNQLKTTLQKLYNLVVIAKEKADKDEFIDRLCKVELLVSNLYYSFFASPLELPEKSPSDLDFKGLILQAIETSKNLIEQINIPEENRTALIINLDLQNLLNMIQSFSCS